MATTQERLDEAKAIYHDLLIGKSVRVYMDQNGERVEYTSANRAALAAYIAELERQLTGAGNGPIWLVC